MQRVYRNVDDLRKRQAELRERYRVEGPRSETVVELERIYEMLNMVAPPKPMPMVEMIAREMMRVQCEQNSSMLDDEIAQTVDRYWRLHSTAAVAVLKAMRVPTLEQKRGLLKHRGYDPDAQAETLDTLGNLDVATMGVFVTAYIAMIDAAIAEAGA